MYLIAGLGNPTKKYEGTRHNVGFETVDIIADSQGIALSSNKHKAVYGQGFIGGEKVILAKPQTFMNLSGEAVSALLSYYKEDPAESLIIISDDIDLPVGHIRIRKSGSPGGHNGLKDIVSRIGTQEFIRIRIGVGQKPADWDLADYVLSRFVPEDRKKIDEAEEAAASAVEAILTDGVDKAMNVYNRFLPEEERAEAERLAELKREEAARRKEEAAGQNGEARPENN